MPYEPRTIALLCELAHPPMQPDPAPVQAIHNQMFQEGQPAYSSFAVSPMGPVLSNPDPVPGRISQVLFLPDQVQFREELGALMHEAFATRVDQIAGQYSQARGLENYAGQRVTVRALLSPKNRRDARRFVSRDLLGFESAPDEVSSPIAQHFGKEADLSGLRLAFEGGPGEPATIGLRIESYSADPRSVFVELQGSYGPLGQADGEGIGARVHQLYDYMEARTLPFIESFDIPV